MEMNVHHEKKAVDIWLTRGETNDPAVQTRLKGIYAQYKEKKYQVTVFQSGNQDLYQSTLDLLAYNKRRIAQLAVQQEKQRPNIRAGG